MLLSKNELRSNKITSYNFVSDINPFSFGLYPLLEDKLLLPLRLVDLKVNSIWNVGNAILYCCNSNDGI